MDELEFRSMLQRELVPLLEGTIAEEQLGSTSREGLVSYIRPTRIAVKPSIDSTFKVAIDRSQAFDPIEKSLAEHFIEEFAAILALNSDQYLNELLLSIPRRVVARHLEGGTILREVLEQLETWAAQTYEGQRVVTSIGLVPATATPGPSIRNFWDQDFAHVLTNGFDTIILFDSNGMHAGFMQLSVNSSSKTGPYRLRQISEWAKGKKIAAVLNRHGEILIFKDRSLRFAKRRGRWVHYVHETNVRRLSPPRNRPFRDQLYASCLDVSFARTGGCIGILDADRIDLIGRLASVYDIISDRASYKTQLLYSSTKPNFQSLDRRFRQEMISMDGAVILDHQGHVLAAGAIVKVPAGSAGGGRLAAANELSKSGLGIKISQDGTIIALRNEVEVFRA